jgi:hypothetical protein
MALRKAAKRVLKSAESADRLIVKTLSRHRSHRAQQMRWKSDTLAHELLKQARAYDIDNFERYSSVLKRSNSLRLYLILRHYTLGNTKKAARRILR